MAGVRTSKSLHKNCMDKLMHCPISFFEKTPSGRIIARFTSDLSNVDLNLSRFSDNLWQLFATLLGLAVVVAILVPPVIVVIAISVGLFVWQVLTVDVVNRIIKRENNLAMSPLQLTISENVDGKVLARNMKFNSAFDKKFIQNINHWTRTGFTSMSIINTSMLGSNLVSLLISTCTALYIIFTDTLSPSLSGLALTYSFLIPYFLLNFGNVLTIVLSCLNSLERVVDYTSDKLPQEPAWYLTNASPDNSPGKVWPSSGNIEFRNVTLIYRPGLDPSLTNVSFTMEAREKVGIIGRTGAGKSSLILLLLRILDPSSGAIYIDDVDIKSVGLIALRRAISIIPQKPLLLRGSIKDNIAPFGDNSLEKMRAALYDSGLISSFPTVRFQSNSNLGSKKVAPQSSNFGIEDKDVMLSDNQVSQLLNSDAESLSAGQKQLLSLARCLLNESTKILVCDEPTSNVDIKTDMIVQKVIRTAFVNSTIITVAHRLETIADNDKIIVMERGRVKMIDSPAVILKSPTGMAYTLDHVEE